MPSGFEKKPADVSSPGRPPARIGDLLREDCVLFWKGPNDKAALLDALVAKIGASYGLENALLSSKIGEREGGISTTLDTGLSLPHARLDELSGIAAGLAVAPDGVSEPRQPNLSIRAVFLFFSPNRPEFFSSHLQILRSVSTGLSRSMIDQFSRAASAAEVLALLRSSGS